MKTDCRESHKRSWGELAKRLQAQHHGVVALISCREKLRRVSRQQGKADRREVKVSLAAKGECIAARMAQLHCDEPLLNRRGNVLLPQLQQPQQD